MKKLFAILLAALALPAIGFAQNRTDLSNVYQKLRQEDHNYFKTHKAKTIMPTVFDAGVSNSSSSNKSSSSNNSSNSGSQSSTTSNKGTLVARVTAFGIYDAFGSTTTTTQTLEVYSEGGRYYVWDHHLYGDVKQYLSSNTKSTYKGYSVGQYNYTAGPWSYHDIIWFIKL